MSDLHPLALAYLRASAEAHHARSNVVPTGMPSPRAAMRRARDAWQRAGCPVEAASEPVSRPVTVPCQLTADDGWLGAAVVVRVTQRRLFVEHSWGVGAARIRAYSRKTGRRIRWPGVRVVDPEAAAAAWLRANGGGA